MHGNLRQVNINEHSLMADFGASYKQLARWHMVQINYFQAKNDAENNCYITPKMLNDIHICLNLFRMLE